MPPVPPVPPVEPQPGDPLPDADGEAVDDGPADPVETLTIAELDAGSRLLHADLVHAVSTPGSEHRWAALAVVAYLHDRRRDPSSDVGRFRRMTAGELSRALGLDRQAAPSDAEAGPTAPGRG